MRTEPESSPTESPPSPSCEHGPMLELLVLGDVDGDVVASVESYLAEAGYRVRALDTFDALRSHLAAGAGDAVLMALQHVDRSRDCVIEIRKLTSKPILLFHHPDNVETALELLELGADDLVCHDVQRDRPVALRELRIRLASSLRASALLDREVGGRVLSVADVTLDTATHTVRRGRQVIDLTRIEFQLLHRLMAAVGEIVPHDDLLRGVWSESQTERLSYLRVYMTRLRRHLGWTGDAGPRIQAVRGRGYRLETPTSDEEAAS